MKISFLKKNFWERIYLKILSFIEYFLISINSNDVQKTAKGRVFFLVNLPHFCNFYSQSLGGKKTEISLSFLSRWMLHWNLINAWSNFCWKFLKAILQFLVFPSCHVLSHTLILQHFFIRMIYQNSLSKIPILFFWKSKTSSNSSRNEKKSDFLFHLSFPLQIQ